MNAFFTGLAYGFGAGLLVAVVCHIIHCVRCIGDD